MIWASEEKKIIRKQQLHNNMFTNIDSTLIYQKFSRNKKSQKTKQKKENDFFYRVDNLSQLFSRSHNSIDAWDLFDFVDFFSVCLFHAEKIHRYVRFWVWGIGKMLDIL